jgi:hypothetical protein
MLNSLSERIEPQLKEIRTPPHPPRPVQFPLRGNHSHDLRRGAGFFDRSFHRDYVSRFSVGS